MRETRKMKMNKRGAVLDEDIIEQEILSRLPVKSLLRFKCVCKRWRSLISDDPIFIRQHSQNFKASPGFVYWGTKASCNGILCGFDAWYGIWLCNPVTKEMITVSNPAKRHLLGLAFDPNSTSPHYHLVCPYKTCGSTYSHHSSAHTEHGFDVFSSDTQVWRQSKGKIMLPHQSWARYCRSLFIDGVLYFMGTGMVIWFNPEKDLAGVTPLPADNNKLTVNEIGEWEGMLSCIRITETEVDIWVMSHSQWRKRFCVKLERMVVENDVVFSPICHTMNLRSRKAKDILLSRLYIFPLPFNGGDIIFLWARGRIFSYNLKTGEASEFHRFAHCSPYNSLPYINSFVALPKQRSG